MTKLARTLWYVRGTEPMMTSGEEIRPNECQKPDATKPDNI
jgi:hypothetical protein